MYEHYRMTRESEHHPTGPPYFFYIYLLFFYVVFYLSTIDEHRPWGVPVCHCHLLSFMLHKLFYFLLFFCFCGLLWHWRVLLNKCIARSLLTLFSPLNSSVTNTESEIQGVAMYLSQHLPERDTHLIKGVTTPRRACSFSDWRHPERAEGEGERGELSLAI